MSTHPAEPTALSDALERIAEPWSPHVVARVNDYDVKLAHAEGEHLWHVHEHTDEFFLVVEGELRIGLREPDGGERTVTLPRGAVFTVPRGVEHRPVAAPGTAIMMFEPAGTVNVGDRHEAVPAHIPATTGFELA
ncbi:cupin [Streptomyces sp. CNQ-509]|uniref:cupin domain-containing protein n=1 Tax=unclassified Streptomyces TaxID=2593676 RepID=UPI00062DFB78|nr:MULTISPECIES: cupin domain-containing protein [unclassified Streptomyces]AKH84140.1 cupin [Streptomyces sp. CNQ-509]AZM47973.1 cupin domain-containing protein [Streptomyces sp. WAC 06738]